MSFEDFHEAFGPGQTYRNLSDTDRERLSGKLPEGLMELWEADGWAVYRGGLVTTCDPDFLRPAAEAWFPDNPEVMLFGHGAFGDLFVWDGQEVGILDPHVGQLDPIALDAIELFDMAFTRKPFITKALHETRVKQLRDAAGAPDWDEMYGYEPALALGGSGELKTIRRYKILEHLVFLAQAVGLQR